MNWNRKWDSDILNSKCRAFLTHWGRPMPKDAHRHRDHAGVGSAMTEEPIVREMGMMTEIGVNFIGLGHYQQSRIVLEQCDLLGILVREEIPWNRGGLGGPPIRPRRSECLPI